MADMNLIAGISVYRITPLRGTENYNTWRIQMEDILTDLALYEYVTGDEAFPPYATTTSQATTPTKKEGDSSTSTTETTHNEGQKTWLKTDRRALTQIRLRVDLHALTHIQSCTTSKEAWDILASTFRVQGTVGLIDLRRKFFGHRMNDGEDVEEHMRKMREWYQQIKVIAPAGISEADWITTLVSSLPNSWDSFTQSIDFNFDLANTSLLATKVADLRARILAKAHRRSTREDTGKSFFGNSRPQNGHFTRNFTSNRPNAHGPDKSNSKCHNCGRTGHWVAECRQPGGGAYNGNTNKENNRQQEMNNYRRFSRPIDWSREPEHHSHNAIDSEETPEPDNSRSFSFSANDGEIGTISEDRDQWIADSGTTTHIAYDRASFVDYRAESGTITSVAGENTIIGRGTIVLKSQINPDRREYATITLKDVAHIPSCPTNLISLSLVSDHGLDINMGAMTLHILSPRDGVVALGEKKHDRMRGNLWKMLCTTVRDVNAAESFSTETKRTSELVDADIWRPAYTPTISRDMNHESCTNVYTQFPVPPIIETKDGTLEKDSETSKAVFTRISDVNRESRQYYKNEAKQRLHPRHVAFIEGSSSPSTHDTGDEVLIPVAPSAEGETGGEYSSKTERPIALTGKGGATPSTQDAEIDSASLSATHSPAEAIPQVDVLSTTLSTFSQLSKPSPAPSANAINVLARTSSVLAPRTPANTPDQSPSIPGVTVHAQTHSRGAVPLDIVHESKPGAVGDSCDKATNAYKTEGNVNSTLKPFNAYVDSPAGQEDIESCDNPEEREPVYPSIERNSRPARIVQTTKTSERHQEHASTEPILAHALRDGIYQQVFDATSDTGDSLPTYEAATNDFSHPQWLAAMEEEDRQLVAMETHKHASRLPPTANDAIKSKWVLRIRRDEHIQIDRIKVRLVAKGLTRFPGQDFVDTFTPTPHQDTPRLLVALDVQSSFDTCEFSSVTAYFPYKLNTTLFSLKQFTDTWHHTFDATLKPLGHMRLLIDFERYYCTFTLSTHWQTYAQSIVKYTFLKNAVPANTSATPATQLTRHERPPLQYTYARIIYCLMYATVCPRLDLTCTRIACYLNDTAYYGNIFHSSEYFHEIEISNDAHTLSENHPILTLPVESKYREQLEYINTGNDDSIDLNEISAKCD